MESISTAIKILGALVIVGIGFLLIRGTFHIWINLLLFLGGIALIVEGIQQNSGLG